MKEMAIRGPALGPCVAECYGSTSPGVYFQITSRGEGYIKSSAGIQKWVTLRPTLFYMLLGVCLRKPRERLERKDVKCTPAWTTRDSRVWSSKSRPFGSLAYWVWECTKVQACSATASWIYLNE